MAVSVFDLFSVGIGPSSSHTVGPMRAAKMFVDRLRSEGGLDRVHRVRAFLYGSLGATGKGHGSDKAILAGLHGYDPQSIDPDHLNALVANVQASKMLNLGQEREIQFDPIKDLKFNRKVVGDHPNTIELRAIAVSGEEIVSRTYYSIGGGFVLQQGEQTPTIVADSTRIEFPFTTGEELLRLCEDEGISISTLMMRNELAWRERKVIEGGLTDLWAVMQDCIARGCANEGVLPGGLKVKRRAPHFYRRLKADNEGDLPLGSMDWVNLWALAVNEENAAGGRIVTAPTNGAAGIIPAVLSYYHRFCKGADEDGTVRFLLTAGAIGSLFKLNASISGAEVGCQGEVGSACSMAAAGLAEVLGGTPLQVENAAEIGMEHNLGLTCDPIGGLVQVPCIERNAMGAVKAINAARLALRGDGRHFVSLDKVIRVMRDTGRDMKTKYKETARGGLAVNVIEC